jgi:hypothetical protein
MTGAAPAMAWGWLHSWPDDGAGSAEPVQPPPNGTRILADAARDNAGKIVGFRLATAAAMASISRTCTVTNAPSP